MNVPAAPSVYTAAYLDFKGVDFTSAICDRQHFPLAKNFVIKDTVEKRTGYERMAEFPDRINGIYKFKLGSEEYTFVHSGDKIYKTNEDFSEPELLYSNVNDEKSTGCCTGNEFLILTGLEIIRFGKSKIYDDEKIVKYTLPDVFEEWKYSFSCDLSVYSLYYYDADNNKVFLNEGTDYIYDSASKQGYIINPQLIGIALRQRNISSGGESSFMTISTYEQYNVSNFKVDIVVSAYDDYNARGSITAKIGLTVIDESFYGTDGYLYIPKEYAGKTVELIYTSTDTSIDTSADDRYYFSSFRLERGLPNQPSVYFQGMNIPVIRRGLTYFRSNSYGSDDPVTYDKLIQNHSGEATGDEYNLMTPYVAYECDSYERRVNNTTANFTQGYVIEAAESSLFGSQHSYIMFEDGRVFSAYVTRKTVNYIANSSDSEKGNLYLSFVTADSSNDPIPSSYTGKPFKILFPNEYAAKLWNANMLWKCKKQSYLYYGNGMYYFYSGNAEFPNRDWHSEINSPLDVRATSYTIYGVNDEVAGYGQYGAYLAVFKKGGNDKNIYVRQAQYIDSLGVTFPISVGVGGAMCVLSENTIENLAGETMYLSSDGVYALTTLSISDFQVTKKRSYFIDGRLKRELNPENAVACTWRGMYLLAINGNVYVLDGTQQKSFIEGTSNEYSYECLFWDNIPARIFFNHDEELYFGTEDGRIMRFCDAYSDDGEPIDMVVATKLDDDGDFMSLKKMQKKGTGILVMPHQRSSFDISFRYDSNAEAFVKTAYADIFDFNDIDFERFTFQTSENPRIIPFLKKSKKYKALQIILRSKSSEPFSLSGILKRYTVNNYVKK